MAGRYRQIDGCIDSSQWRVVRATIHTKADPKKKIHQTLTSYLHAQPCDITYLSLGDGRERGGLTSESVDKALPKIERPVHK